MNPLYFLLSCLVGVGLLVGLARVVLFIVEVEGQSMIPALLHGDRVLVLRFWPGRWLRRGQIVVTHYLDSWQTRQPDALSEQKYIKRVTGLPGDTMTVETLHFPAPQKAAASERLVARTWHVPPGHYFVQGDSWGLDSRIVGPLPFGALCGLVIMKLKRRGEHASQPAPLEIPSPTEPEKP
ncbi:MAG TPA: signal peptidase I [Chloroflexota bacterium]|nr:signal peptidase I [Chloroflexota bacterium]HUM68667.1 signal peptidase I [Chloroflexota bacterium]